MEGIDLIDIESYKNDKKYKKALGLVDKVKLDYITSKHISFSVDNNEVHSVIYFRERKEDRWQCDCKWFSLHGTNCSHILAVNIAIMKGHVKFE